MKLRIKGNSIRLRLSQGEVNRLRDLGELVEMTTFGGVGSQALTYVAITDGSVAELSATYASNTITVRLPRASVVTWADDEAAVGIYGVEKVQGGADCLIAVEKDFSCLAGSRDGEDDSDAFPNPTAAAGRC
jgi:hypothetical protein